MNIIGMIAGAAAAAAKGHALYVAAGVVGHNLYLRAKALYVKLVARAKADVAAAKTVVKNLEEKK